MTDDDIVYDEDTGAPFSADDLTGLEGVVVDGLDDLPGKMKELSAKQ